jgi:hypothetical protein
MLTARSSMNLTEESSLGLAVWLHFNSGIWEARRAHRRSLGFARDDNFVWER